MRPATDVRSYRSDPVGRFVAGRSWVHFTTEDGLCGLLLFGRVAEDDVQGIVAAMGAELPERAPRHVSYDDARRLEHVDPHGFEAFVRFIRENNGALALNATRQAVVRPQGLVGAVVAGFFDLVPPEGTTRVFGDARDAARFLGRDPDRLLPFVDGLYESTLGIAPIVRAVRDRLEARGGRANVAEIARALGVSPRTLQDQLKRAGTSLRAETNAARVRHARVMLEETDAKLAHIAHEIGCASAQHFSTLFRKATGLTPSEWRARAR